MQLLGRPVIVNKINGFVMIKKVKINVAYPKRLGYILTSEGNQAFGQK